MKQYQTDKAERETERAASMEAVSPIELARVAEPEFQYGAEAFETYEKGNTGKTADNLSKKASKPVATKSR